MSAKNIIPGIIFSVEEANQYIKLDVCDQCSSSIHVAPLTSKFISDILNINF